MSTQWLVVSCTSNVCRESAVGLGFWTSRSTDTNAYSKPMFRPIEVFNVSTIATRIEASLYVQGNRIIDIRRIVRSQSIMVDTSRCVSTAAGEAVVQVRDFNQPVRSGLRSRSSSQWHDDSTDMQLFKRHGGIAAEHGE